MYSNSLKSNIKNLFFNAYGRLSRENFVVAFAIVALFTIMTPIFTRLCGALFPGFLAGFIALACWIYIIYAHFVICIKRLHDMNLTGWLSIFVLPLYIPVVFLVLKKGNPESNQYGEPSNYTGEPFILKASYVILALYSIGAFAVFGSFFLGLGAGIFAGTGT